jgi:hypothetical protein
MDGSRVRSHVTDIHLPYAVPPRADHAAQLGSSSAVRSSRDYSRPRSCGDRPIPFGEEPRFRRGAQGGRLVSAARAGPGQPVLRRHRDRPARLGYCRADDLFAHLDAAAEVVGHRLPGRLLRYGAGVVDRGAGPALPECRYAAARERSRVTGIVPRAPAWAALRAARDSCSAPRAAASPSAHRADLTVPAAGMGKRAQVARGCVFLRRGGRLSGGPTSIRARQRSSISARWLASELTRSGRRGCPPD